jgi:hypothetical protein
MGIEVKRAKVELSSTFALFEMGKTGLAWCNNAGHSVTRLTTTMKGSEYAAARLCYASTEYVSAGFFHPDL